MVKINAVTLGLAAAAIAAPAARADDNCKPLTTDSDIVKALISSDAVTEEDAKAAIESIKDSDLGKCVASLEMADALSLAGVLTDDTCTNVANEKNLKQLEAIIETPESLIKDNDVATATCGVLKDATGCLTNKIVDPLYKVLQSKDCCKPLLSTIETAVGPMDKAVNKFATDVTDALCSKRESYSDKNKEITCLAAMEPAFFTSNENALNLVRIPNDQGAKAFNGEGFTNTEKNDVKFPKAYGACAIPLDKLVSDVAALPVIKGNDDAKKLFADGQCLESSKIGDALGEIPLVGSQIAGLFPNSSDACIHLANGFSKGAKFDTDATLPNGKSASTLVDSMNSDGSEGSKNAGAMTSVSVAAAAVVAVAQFFL
jgi:hypothetical protein